MRSRDRRIFEKKSIYEFKTLTHNIVNMVSDWQFWTGSSDLTCFKYHLTKVWWLGDYVTWRNYENSFFLTWAILELLITQISTYAHISNWNSIVDSMDINFFYSSTQIFKDTISSYMRRENILDEHFRHVYQNKIISNCRRKWTIAENFLGCTCLIVHYMLFYLAGGKCL